MRSLISLLLALWLAPAWAQVPMTGAGTGSPAASYVGPGDVLSGALAFYGFQAYNAAYNGNAANVCLPSDTTCADITVQGSTITVPGSLSTCNNSTVLCTVKTFYDQSGALACAGSTACNQTQATIGSRATFVVPGASNGCPLSTQYCWTTALGTIYQSTANFTRAQPWSVSAAVNHASHAVSHLFMGAFSTNLQIGFDGSGAGVLRLYALTTVQTWSSGTSDGTWLAVQYQANGASSTLNANGSGSGNVTTGTAGWSAETMTLGNIGGLGFVGNIGEIGLWPGSITGLNANVRSRWGF